MFGRTSSALNNICREGVVSEVIPERHSCKVTFPDRQNLVSAELPVLIPLANEDKTYCLPSVGTRVVVLMSSNDKISGGGYILGCLYTAEVKPPADCTEQVFKIEFGDKTFFQYDKVTKMLTLQFADGSAITFDGTSGELEFKIKGDILITGEKRLDVSIKENIEVETKAELNADAKDDMNFKASNIRLN